ncbi:MAG: alkaline phosphatase family protein [Terriglobales bacterium]
MDVRSKASSLAIILFICFATAAGAQVAHSARVPQFQHVFVLVEENETYDKVIGNTADMPYLNSLANNYGLATNYFADTHPSINNYFYLTSGRKGTGFLFYGVAADLYPFDVDVPNIASILTKYGRTWKSYAESLPHAGYIGGNKKGYAKRHDPFAYYESVRDNKDQRKNIVPFKQLQKDIKDDKLPDFGFIVPNIYDDAHNDPPGGETGIAPCGDHPAMQQADKWLKENIGPLIDSPPFANSLLIITFDEACATGPDGDWRFSPQDKRRDGGGHVATILISPRIKPGTRSNELYHHESVLRTALEVLGIDEFPGRAAHARSMSEFFTATPNPKGK